MDSMVLSRFLSPVKSCRLFSSPDHILSLNLVCERGLLVEPMASYPTMAQYPSVGPPALAQPGVPYGWPSEPVCSILYPCVFIADPNEREFVSGLSRKGFEHYLCC